MCPSLNLFERACCTCKCVAQGLRRKSLQACRCHYPMELHSPFSSAGAVHSFLMCGGCQEGRSLSVCQSRALLGKKPQQFVLSRYWDNSYLLCLEIQLSNQADSVEWNSVAKKKKGTKVLLASSFFYLSPRKEKKVALLLKAHLCCIVLEENRVKGKYVEWTG